MELLTDDLYRKVVDQVLNGATLRLSLDLRKGEPFNGKVMDFTLDVTASGQGQWITGLETLNRLQNLPRPQ